MSNIILISGPGGAAFNNLNVQMMNSALSDAGANVIMIGDGERPIDKAEMSKALADNITPDKSVTIFIMAHGEARNGYHAIDLHGNYSLKTKDFFEQIANLSDRNPIDIFMTSCHGGGAIPDMDILPDGSTLVVLSPKTETVSGSDVNQLAQNIDATRLDATGLVETYLGKALKNRIAPVIAKAGTGVYDLPKNFIARCGRPFSDDEQKRAHSKLDAILGNDRVSSILKKVTDAKDEWGISAVDFGAALAVVHAAAPKVKTLGHYELNSGSYSGATNQIDAGFFVQPRRFKP